jgi:hypothetical protein
MEPITLWLVWTLLGGQPVDANTYMTEDACKTQLVEAREMLAHAKAQRPDIPDFQLVGCQPVPVKPLAQQKGV